MNKNDNDMSDFDTLDSLFCLYIDEYGEDTASYEDSFAGMLVEIWHFLGIWGNGGLKLVLESEYDWDRLERQAKNLRCERFITALEEIKEFRKNGHMGKLPWNLKKIDSSYDELSKIVENALAEAMPRAGEGSD